MNNVLEEILATYYYIPCNSSDENGYKIFGYKSNDADKKIYFCGYWKVLYNSDILNLCYNKPVLLIYNKTLLPGNLNESSQYKNKYCSANIDWINHYTFTESGELEGKQYTGVGLIDTPIYITNAIPVNNIEDNIPEGTYLFTPDHIINGDEQNYIYKYSHSDPNINSGIYISNWVNGIVYNVNGDLKHYNAYGNTTNGKSTLFNKNYFDNEEDAVLPKSELNDISSYYKTSWDLMPNIVTEYDANEKKYFIKSYKKDNDNNIDFNIEIIPYILFEENCGIYNKMFMQETKLNSDIFRIKKITDINNNIKYIITDINNNYINLSDKEPGIYKIIDNNEFSDYTGLLILNKNNYKLYTSNKILDIYNDENNIFYIEKINKISNNIIFNNILENLYFIPNTNFYNYNPYDNVIFWKYLNIIYKEQYINFEISDSNNDYTILFKYLYDNIYVGDYIINKDDTELNLGKIFIRLNNNFKSLIESNHSFNELNINIDNILNIKNNIYLKDFIINKLVIEPDYKYIINEIYIKNFEIYYNDNIYNLTDDNIIGLILKDITINEYDNKVIKLILNIKNNDSIESIELTGELISLDFIDKLIISNNNVDTEIYFLLNIKDDYNINSNILIDNALLIQNNPIIFTYLNINSVIN